MDTDTTANPSGAIGFVGLLTITFMALKLTGLIAWSWLWVLSPLWMIPAIAITGLAIIMVRAFVRELLA